MNKATKAHIDALNRRENTRQWKRDAAEQMYSALKVIATYPCGCRSSDKKDWHADTCYMPILNGAIAKAEGRQ